MLLVTAQEMRDMDRQTIEDFGIPGRVLMESAGRGATDMLCRALDLSGRDIAVMAGKGNNGGDGFVMARLLAGRGYKAAVYLLARAGAIQGDAAANLALLAPMGIPVIEVPDQEAFFGFEKDMARHNVWIDAILGTGLDSEVRGFYKHAIEFLNSRQAFVFSVDIPSGLCADTGLCGACVRANATATFAFAKVGHHVPPGREMTGRLEVLDIGIPPHIASRVGATHCLLTSQAVASLIKPRSTGAHKGDTGHLLIIAGSPGKTGAAAMAAASAMRSGAGLVTLGVPESLLSETGARTTVEVMTAPLPRTSQGGLGLAALPLIMDLCKGKKALALGPGLGTEPETLALAREIAAQSPVPVIVDADGLNALAGHLDTLKNARSPVILTPHPGEMARLCGTTPALVQKDRIALARGLSQEHGVICVLKGAATLVARPDGLVHINPTGNPGMASGGMGDVLTGVIGGLAVQGLSPEDAARAGVFIHGMAADLCASEIGATGFLASDCMAALPRVLERLRAV